MNLDNHKPIYRFTLKSLHIDYLLLGLITLLVTFGLFILYSAANQNIAVIYRQGGRLIMATFLMLFLAFIPPHRYKNSSPWVYGMGLVLLIAVMIMGKIGKGAQRWLDIGIFRFQPSEIMKFAVPMIAAWYFDKHHQNMTWKCLFKGLALIIVPTVIIAKQPDLGTAILVLASGLTVVFLAGIDLKIVSALFISGGLFLPVLWHFMHDYQKQRIYTLLDPEQDPLGTGYHIIQSKIAIGSGGSFGKGWLMGSQSHLNFLPEHATDFIFAVNGEEFGFIGALVIIILMLLISIRSLIIAKEAQTPFTSLLAASLSMSFFISAFVNIGMVSGILPVVGIPLPLVSYGGTAMLTFLASFGILMSISTHKILFNSLKNR